MRSVGGKEMVLVDGLPRLHSRVGIDHLLCHKGGGGIVPGDVPSTPVR